MARRNNLNRKNKKIKKNIVLIKKKKGKQSGGNGDSNILVQLKKNVNSVYIVASKDKKNLKILNNAFARFNKILSDFKTTDNNTYDVYSMLSTDYDGIKQKLNWKLNSKYYNEVEQKGKKKDMWFDDEIKALTSSTGSKSPTNISDRVEISDDELKKMWNSAEKYGLETDIRKDWNIQEALNNKLFGIRQTFKIDNPKICTDDSNLHTKIYDEFKKKLYIKQNSIHPPYREVFDIDPKLTDKQKENLINQIVKDDQINIIWGDKWQSIFSPHKNSKGKINDLIISINKYATMTDRFFNRIDITDTINYNDEKFHLASVICHVNSESVKRGHYIAYALRKTKTNNKNEWYKLDDEKYKAVDINHEDYKNEINENGVICLYRKTSPKKISELPERSGIENTGATCYMNSLTQLLQTTHFYNNFDNNSKYNQIKKYRELKNFLDEMNVCSMDKPKLATHITGFISKNHLNIGKQQDPTEMLQIIENNFLPEHTKNSLDKNEDNIYFIKYPMIESMRDKCISGKKFDNYINRVILADEKKQSDVGKSIEIKPLFPKLYTDKNHYKTSSTSQSSLPESIKVLLERQSNKFQGISDELDTNNGKKGHYSWWIWPTYYPGPSELGSVSSPSKQSSFLTPNEDEFREFMVQADKSRWTKILNKFTELMKANGKTVIPSEDHDRIPKFYDLFLNGEFKDKSGKLDSTNDNFAIIVSQYQDFRQAIDEFKTQFRTTYNITSGGKRRTRKSVRKHRGIIQTGGNTGRLRKGYKYTGRRFKNGKAEIVRVKRN